MRLIFIQGGKYKSGVSVVIVKQEDVDAKKVFDIVDANAVNFIKVGKAEQAKIGKVEKPDNKVK